MMKIDHTRRLMLHSGLVLGTGIAATSAVCAQIASTSPMTIVIPFAPGGASDIVVRTLVDELATRLGRPVIAQNRGGAGGTIAARAVARSTPAEAQLLYANMGQIAVGPALFPEARFDPVADFRPLTLTAQSSFILVVPRDPAKPTPSVASLLAAAKRERLRFGIPGFGAAPHLAAARLAEVAGVEFDYVAYKGSAPMLVDLIAGRLDAAFDNTATALPHIRSGRLGALGSSGVQRPLAAPDIPTLAQAGLPDFTFNAWQGLLAPASLPDADRDRLVTVLREILSRADIRDKLAATGLEPISSSPEDFGRLIARDISEWSDRVRRGVVRGE